MSKIPRDDRGSEFPPIPGQNPGSGTRFPPKTPHVFTGRTVRIDNHEDFKNLPKGAIRLTRPEVIEAAYRYRERKEFRAYRKLENVWPAVGGFACMWTSCYVISIVRHKFKLGRYHARAIHYISGSALPAVMVPIFHVPVVYQAALIKETPCSDCLGIRSGLLQIAGGLIWSTVLAFGGALYYAKRFHTVPLPPINPRHFKDYMKIFSQPLKPAMPWLFGHTMFQFVIGYVGGVKFWYRGQELNAVDNYVAMRSAELSGEEAPQLVPYKVQTDKFTEFVATGITDKLLGIANAKEGDEDDEEGGNVLLSFFSRSFTSLSRMLFGGNDLGD